MGDGANTDPRSTLAPTAPCPALQAAIRAPAAQRSPGKRRTGGPSRVIMERAATNLCTDTSCASTRCPRPAISQASRQAPVPGTRTLAGGRSPNGAEDKPMRSPPRRRAGAAPVTRDVSHELPATAIGTRQSCVCVRTRAVRARRGAEHQPPRASHSTGGSNG